MGHSGCMASEPGDSTAMVAATPVEREIAHRFARLTNHSADVVEVADRTYTIPRVDGVLMRPEGMSEAEWNIHQDAMASSRNMPGYLAAHFRRVELAQKIAGERRADLPPIAGFVVHLVQQKQYDVVDVTPEAIE